MSSMESLMEEVFSEKKTKEGYDMATSPGTNEGAPFTGKKPAFIPGDMGPIDDKAVESYLSRISQEQENELSEMLKEYSPEEVGDLASILANLYKSDK